MEALSISNAVAPPALQVAATPSTQGTGAPASGQPVFAQMVHEAMVRISRPVAETSAQPKSSRAASTNSGSASSRSSAKEKTSAIPSDKSKAIASDSSADPNSVNSLISVATSLVPVLPLTTTSIDGQPQPAPAPAAPAATAQTAARPAFAEALGGSQQASTQQVSLPADAAGQALQTAPATALQNSSSSGNASSETASKDLLPQIQAQLAETVAATPSAEQASATPAANPSAQPGAPASGAAPIPAGNPAASSQPFAVASGPVVDPSGKMADPQAVKSTLAATTGPSSVVPQDPASPAAGSSSGAKQPQPQFTGTAAADALHTQTQQEVRETAKSVIATLPLLGAHAPVLFASNSAPKALNLAEVQHVAAGSQELRAAALGGHAGSRDASSNQNGSPNGDNPAPLDGAPSATPAHDMAAFGAMVSSTSATRSDVTPTTAPAVATAPLAPQAAPERNTFSAGASQDAPASSRPSLGPFQGEDATPSRFVNSAQLLSASGHSEMRISMDTDKLGAVELRARLVGDQVGAAIMVEKRDAHAALAVELPTLQQALSEKQLRVDQVTLQQGTFSATTGDAGASARQQQHTMPQGPVAVWASETPGVAAISSSATANGIFDSQGRLSVHA